ncbi:hypothetical protein [Rubrimonas cliftonensis]|uniref:LysM domain-containing protein n=1 Tax=Rubrimonas cliftonensis TaxID=89524 RepID=A0A1H3YRP3_9RHOB|nr:hypothetical protein [Rubrimonas cliftonensis]SEA13881.1 hypothetical protein SAMN05444370_103207 [Rubrimonas cliftonensis]
MSRVAKRPLDPAAVSAANDAFYAAHPEMIAADGARIPIGDGADQAAYRTEWMDHYVAAGGALEGDDPTPAEEPVQPCPLSWIKFQFLAKEGDLPLAGVEAVVMDPNGAERRATSDAQGVIEIRPAAPGAWAIYTPIEGRTISDTFHLTSSAEAGAPVTASQTPEPEPRPGQTPAEDPNQTRAEAMPWAPRAFAEITKHKVQDGDDLVGLAEQVGLTWDELAFFNFGVKEPEQINRQLRDLVGCTNADANGNYWFTGEDDPGMMFLPWPFGADGLATETVHIFRGESVERPVKLELQTVDALGYRVGGVSLTLVTVEGVEIPVTTDGEGYWTDTLMLTGPVDVFHESGDRAHFFVDAYGAADQADSNEGPVGATELVEARLDPLLVRRALSSILVPGVTADPTLAERDTLRRRYGRTPADREAAQAVSGVSGEGDTEAGDGGPDSDRAAGAFVHRAVHMAVDNVFAAPLAGEDFFLTLDQWLKDRHPTAGSGRGYYLMVARGSTLYVGEVSGGSFTEKATFEIDTSLVYAGDVTLPDGRTVTARNAYGAYAAFEVGRPEPVYFDLETRSQPLSDFNQLDDVDTLQEIVVGADQQQKLIDLQRSLNPKVGVFYLYPENEPRRGAAALLGGCGLLENYPADGAVNARVHARNRMTAQAANAAYRSVISEYVDGVEAVTTVQALHDLGPPMQPYIFPTPAGATRAQALQLLGDQSESSFRAWKAVSEKLAELENRHSSGSMFFRTKFEFASAVNSPVGGGTGKVSFNFDIGTDGYLEKTERTVEAAVGPGGVTIPGLRSAGTAQLKREVNVETGETKDTLEVGLSRGGKSYGFEAASDGNVKMKGPYGTYSEFNSRTAEGGYGLCLSLQDLLASRRERKAAESGTDPEKQSFLAGIPNATFCFGLHFVLLREDQVVSYLVRAPGFFERRLLDELLRCNWNSLSGFEQAQLTAVGWEMATWDRRAPEDFPAPTKKDYSRLEAAEKIAAVKLGFTQLDWAARWNGQMALARSRATVDGGR